MKQKIITLILTIVAASVPLIVTPVNGVFNYNIGKIIILLSAGTLLLILLLASYKSLTLDKKDIIILIFAGLVIISTFLSSEIKKSILGEKHRYEGLLTFATYICIYFCSKKYFKFEKISILFNILFYTYIIIGFFGIVQKYISCKELYPLFNKGICSTLGNSNFFGSFISIVLPISLGIFIVKGYKKGLILSIIMFFNMISSGARSAWVAFCIVGIIGIIYLIKEKNKVYFKRTFIIVICFSLICTYLFGGFGFVHKNVVNEDIGKTNDPIQKVEQVKKDLKRITDKKGNVKKIGSNRLWIWNMSFNVMVKNPIFGCGPDNLKEGIMTYSLEEIYEYAMANHKVVDKAHNEFLHIGATLGIPALLCYLVFISLILFSKIKEAFNNRIYFIIWITIVSYLAQSFFNISIIRSCSTILDVTRNN